MRTVYRAWLLAVLGGAAGAAQQPSPPAAGAWRSHLCDLAVRLRRLRARARPGSLELLAREGRRLGRDGAAVFPTSRDRDRARALRPWRDGYLAPWPRAGGALRDADAAMLRALLADADGAVRGLAIEALATFHEPGDLPALAAHLEDDAAAAPRLVPNPIRVAVLLRPRPATDPRHADLDHDVAWSEDTVGACARRAVTLITGLEFGSRTACEAWLARCPPARHALWWWQRRLEREDAALRTAWSESTPPHAGSRFPANLAQALDAWRAGVRRRLAVLPAEVQAKVRLLAYHPSRGGCALATPEASCAFFAGSDPLGLRLRPSRVRALLEGHLGWPELLPGQVDACRMRAIERIALGWREVLRAADVPWLRARLAGDARRHELWWSARAALVLAVGHLLEGGGRAGTPSGRWLAHCLEVEPDEFVRAEITRALARADAGGHWTALRSAARRASPSFCPNARDALVQSLAEPPVETDRAQRLFDLLLDPDMRSLWRTSNGWRSHVVRPAVNRCAGREVLHQNDCRIDTSPDPEAALKRLLERLRAARGGS